MSSTLLRRASSTATAMRDKLTETASKVKSSLTPSKKTPEAVLVPHLKLICVQLRQRLLAEELMGSSVALFDPEVSLYKYTSDLRALAIIAEGGQRDLIDHLGAFNIQSLAAVLKLVLSALEEPLMPVEVACKMHVLHKTKAADGTKPTVAELTEVLSSNAPGHAINTDVVAQILMLIAKDRTTTVDRLAKSFGPLLFMPNQSVMSHDEVMAAGGAEYLKQLVASIVFVTKSILEQVNVVFASSVIDKAIDKVVRQKMHFATASQRTSRYRAEFDFQAQNANEIDLRAGEIVMVLDKSGEDGWWTGRNERGETGLFPDTYVVADENATVPAAAEIQRPFDEERLARAVASELHESVKQGNRTLLDVSNCTADQGSGEFPAAAARRSTGRPPVEAGGGNGKGGGKAQQLGDVIEARLAGLHVAQ